VIKQTDQYQKFGRTVALKYEFKKSKKCDLNKKKSDFFPTLIISVTPVNEFIFAFLTELITHYLVVLCMM